MVDSKVAGSDNIVEMKEVELSKEQLEKDYCDIKQVAQIFNNVSERTAYRYLDKVSDKYNTKIRTVEVNTNGGVRKLYLKEDIITVAKVMNKDKTVLVYTTEDVHDHTVNDKEQTDKVSEEMPRGVKDSQGAVKGSTELALTRMNEIQGTFLTMSNNLTELNTNMKTVIMQMVQNSTQMTTTFTEIANQGKELAKTWAEDKNKRTEIEAKRTQLATVIIFSVVIFFGIVAFFAYQYFDKQGREVKTEREAYMSQLNEKDSKFLKSLQDRDAEVNALKEKLQALEASKVSR